MERLWLTVRPGTRPYVEVVTAGTLTVASTALPATAAWAGTVVAADRMSRAGYRGPFELLIGRITYGRR